ncbi:MAG: hypothetical protein SRB1_02657 [Desulfobacteraceae bacterium Eth-SRB1]|nr:MAG: hypothetical protein SRB1_02657 [Desulfobacteraceae bacterium Eth-SRB1]
MSFDNYYSGHIYNGNKDLTVAEISFSVTTTIGGEETSRMYTDDVNIPPQTTADFGFNIVKGDKDADYSWVLSVPKAINPNKANALGYQKAPLVSRSAFCRR